MGAEAGIDRGRLAAALNAIEADGKEARALVEAAWQSPRGRVVGITGPPGVGKSTLAGRLVAAWRARGLTVGALCIDPSSRVSGGALLGDRLRMRLMGDDGDVFVRSLAARGQLGGLAPRAFEAVTLLRAACDRVLVETVGVGQSEVAVSRLADLTVVVIQPGSGDALQFLKAGLMEVFDLLVVNKADLGALAEEAARELRSALRVQGRREVPVALVSAEQDSGVDALVALLEGAAVTHDKRAAALRETVLERFRGWHGEKQVKALGGEAALMTALEGEPSPSPARLEHVLERLTVHEPEPVPAGAKPWIGEVEVDREMAQRLVWALVPELAGMAPVPLDSGWDNTVWLFGERERWVFRFPRRQVAVPYLERELLILPRIAKHLPLPVTVPRWQGVMDNGWPFYGHRFLEGEVAALSDLDDAEKLALAPTWGAFLRALHALDPRVELPIDPLRKVDVLKRWDATLSTLSATGTLTDPILAVLEHARARWTAGPRPRVLSHGDLDGRHLVVSRATSPPTASGVIDWGDVMLGDPAIDLELAFSVLEGDARAAFFAEYGQIDETTAALARFRAITSQAWTLSWARDIGHAAHEAEALRALERATI